MTVQVKHQVMIIIFMIWRGELEMAGEMDNLLVGELYE
jgi:hypothetical protein